MSFSDPPITSYRILQTLDKRELVLSVVVAVLIVVVSLAYVAVIQRPEAIEAESGSKFLFTYMLWNGVGYNLHGVVGDTDLVTSMSQHQLVQSMGINVGVSRSLLLFIAGFILPFLGFSKFGYLYGSCIISGVHVAVISLLASMSTLYLSTEIGAAAMIPHVGAYEYLSIFFSSLFILMIGVILGVGAKYVWMHSRLSANRMKKSLLLMVLCLMLSPSVSASPIQVTLDNDTIYPTIFGSLTIWSDYLNLEVSRDGVPLENAVVEIRMDSGEIIARYNTNDAGRATIPILAKSNGTAHIFVDGVDTGKTVTLAEVGGEDVSDFASATPTVTGTPVVDTSGPGLPGSVQMVVLGGVVLVLLLVVYWWRVKH